MELAKVERFFVQGGCIVFALGLEFSWSWGWGWGWRGERKPLALFLDTKAFKTTVYLF